MVITIIQERKKQRYLVLVLALIIFVILFVVWLGFFRKTKSSVVLPSVPVSIYTIPKVEIDWQFLDRLRSQTSQPFEETAPFQGDFGRKNPFITY